MSFALTHLIGFGAKRAAATGGSYSPPLDTVTGATGAYGLVKLRTAYAGNCIKVRRSSDNTTQDIGFSGTDLDTAAMLTFCGAGDGFIDTWYDQTTNARNLTQATASYQPKIVSSGATVANIGGKPSVNFDGSNDFLNAASAAFIASTAATIISVARATTGGSSTAYNGSNPILISQSGGYWEIGWQSTGGGSAPCVYNAAYSQGRMANKAYTFPTDSIIAWRFSTSTSGHKLYNNGGTAATNTNTNSITSSGSLIIGGSSSAPYPMTGDIAAMILFDTEKSTADTNTIASALASLYGITWSAI